MKKMQCEVCGSTLIKKVDETTFECQSCGVQYDSTEVKKLLMEVTGTVKIDRSDEVKNSIKRAQQFEETGDSKKASEYYNAALDMDADNKVAQEALKNLSEKQKLEDYYIVEPAIDPEENVKTFLNELVAKEDIACDIYNEINIKSVTQKFFTFLFMKANCECKWSAVACNIYYENQTRYRRTRRNGIWVNEPYTEKVEKIERIPRSGTHLYHCEGLAYSSSALDDAINSKLDDSQREQILEGFERLQGEKYSNYKTRKIKAIEIQKEDDVYTYNGYEFDLSVDRNLYARKRKAMLDSYNTSCMEKITEKIGGDFYENFEANRYVRDESVATICIPVQVIEYSYKGTDYIAISDLASKTTTILATYPRDVELTETKANLTTDGIKAQKMSGMGIFGMVCVLVGMIGLFVGEPVVVIIGGSLLAAGSVLMLIEYFKNKKKIKEFEENSLSKQEAIFAPRMIDLTKSYKAFFNVYNDYCSIECAKEAAATSVKIEKTESCISKAGELKEFIEYTQENKTAENDELAELEREKAELIAQRKPSYILIVAGIVVFVLGCILMVPSVVFGLIAMACGFIILWIGLILYFINTAKVQKIDDQIKVIKTKWLEQK